MEELVAVHETGTSGAIWDLLRTELRGGLLRYDRRGWGEAEVPEGYVRTTVEEHSGDLASFLEDLGGEPRLVCGAGFGAVVALDLTVRRPELVRAAVLIEPPLLTFVPEATKGLSRDRQNLAEAAREGGIAAAAELYGSGGLPWLGPGAERIPAELAEGAEHPVSLFAEVGAVPAWAIPFAGLRACPAPLLVVTGGGTPPALLTAAEGLAGVASGSERLALAAGGLPHREGASELAGALGSLA